MAFGSPSSAGSSPACLRKRLRERNGVYTTCEIYCQLCRGVSRPYRTALSCQDSSSVKAGLLECARLTVS